MADFDQRQVVTNLLPLLAVVLMASGVLVTTLPLESKRPVDAERAKISHAGRQDVEARLWQDPFVAMHQVKGGSPAERCDFAKKDRAHHLSTLTRSIRYAQEARSGPSEVTVLPVFVPGGPYFEDSEARRRIRYAVMMALFRDEWVPFEENKLGFVWTFESCVEAPWGRRVPELLPYEWFSRKPSKETIQESTPDAKASSATGRAETREALLVLWIDEDAVTRAPLRGLETLAMLIKHGGVDCRLALAESNRRWGARADQAQRLFEEGLCVVDSTRYRDAEPSTVRTAPEPQIKACEPRGSSRRDCEPVEVEMLCADDCESLDRDQAAAAMPWARTQVIGPWTSATLHGLIRELADGIIQPGRAPRDDRLATPEGWLRFYSSSATAAIDDEAYRKAIADAQGRCEERVASEAQRKDGSARRKATACVSGSADDLWIALSARLVRLTSDDREHMQALVNELRLRLVDATPFRWFGGGGLEDDSVVILAESDTVYARDFRDLFAPAAAKSADKRVDCREEKKAAESDDSGLPCITQFSYLRGLDGILPDGAGAPERAGAPRRNDKLGIQDISLQEAALERADGQSQYDYLRRLTALLDDLDRAERRAHRHGVTAIGMLGNDVYDKLLVLDALRDRFPKAVFFTADLDARLLGRASIRSTRNLVVASAFGLTLHPGLQSRTPPFRDTYQTGIYLSTLVALDEDARARTTPEFESWFREPRVFEIGRTVPADLIPPDPTREGEKTCQWPRPNACADIHPSAGWRSFDPWPTWPTAIALLTMGSITLALGFLISRSSRRIMRAAWFNASPFNVAALGLAAMLLLIGLWRIHQIVLSAGGEPFAWLEGVSIWPTQILRLLILILTVALLVYGRWRLRKNIDEVAAAFALTTLSEREATPSPIPRKGTWARVRWLWRLGSGDFLAGAEPRDREDPWLEYIDRMRLRPSAERILLTTGLFFVFAVALLSLDWPYSPHRGVAAAWFSHVLQLGVMFVVISLLFATFDASAMATRFLEKLCPADTLPRLAEQFARGLAKQYPVSEDALRLWTRFRLAVQLSSAVNRFIYLPFLVLLLLVPTRSRVFDAWDFPLPYIAFLVISIVLALRCALSLRREAAKLKAHVLEELGRDADQCEVAAKLGASTTGPSAGQELPPPALQAELLRRIAEQIRAERSGPFKPLSQEPVIRALLILLGGAGGITTAEFLFLTHG